MAVMNPSLMPGSRPMDDDYWNQYEPVAPGSLSGVPDPGSTAATGPLDQVTQNAVNQSGLSPVTMAEFSRAWESSPFPGTVEGLKQFLASDPRYAAAGITLGGSKGDKVYGPGGVFWGDAVIGAGAGGLGKSRLTGDTGGAPGGNNLASLGYSFGSSMAPWTEQFQAPTAEQAINSPGVQFGLNEANRMMQNSAAAKGTLLNGRVQQAIGASNVGNALGAYGDIYGRALGEYGLKRENFYNNQDRPFDKNYRLAALGKP